VLFTGVRRPDDADAAAPAADGRSASPSKEERS
jgi:hypothetical protein